MNLFRRVIPWAAVTFWATLIGFFAINTNTGGARFLHMEAQTFLLNYLHADRSVAQKVFDVKRNDWDQFQARELSYFFDWVDVQFIALSYKWGWVHFYSITHLVGCALILALFMSTVVRLTSTRFLPVGVVLGLLFFTFPSAYFTVFYFRSAKILVAVATAFFLRELLTLYRSVPERVPKDRYLPMLIVAALTPLCDRQGFFLVAALSALFLTLWVRSRLTLHLQLARLFAMGAGFGLFYNYTLGPFLIQMIQGYAPDFGYQNFQKLDVYRPQFFAKYVEEAWFALLDQVNFFYGGKRWPQAIFTLGILSFLSLFKNPRADRVAITIALSLMFILVMNGVMIFRHPPVIWADVRRLYYWTPIGTLLLFFGAYALSRTLRLFDRKGVRAAILIILTFLFATNLKQIPKHREYIKDGHMKETWLAMPELLLCLEDTRRPISEFKLSVVFAEDCQTLRSIRGF